VRRAILWLRDERADHLRYAGSLVLRQVRQYTSYAVCTNRRYPRLTD